MYVHAKQRELEGRLKALFDEVDAQLEDRWGHLYPLHPNRLERGRAGNPEDDGLFETAADFTAGIGSSWGRGYLVSIRVATLSKVPPDVFEEILQGSALLVASLLPKYFPERELRVERDGPRFKIIGNFGLGNA